MLIAVEGPDGAGKTTFVEMLSSLLPELEVRHSGPPTGWPVSEYELGVQDYVPGGGHDIVYDRLHVGEQVYGPLYRGHGMTENEYEHVTATMASKGLVTVFLMPPAGTAAANVSRRGDTMVEPGSIAVIRDSYVNMIKSYRLPNQVYGHYPNEADAARVLKLAYRAETMVMPVAELNSYVGWVYPQVLFVGDKKSSMAREHKQAFVPWPGKSGDFLMSAIRSKYVTWGAVNASEDNVAAAVRAVRPEKVVALGDVASKALRGIRHREANHPSYVCRWTTVSPAAYAETL